MGAQVTDELLLKLIAQDEASDAMDEARKRLESMTDAEKESLKASQAAADADKQRVRGLADLKAGLDMAKEAFGAVRDFVQGAINDTVEYAAQVRDLSRAIGANAEESSSLVQVADDVGVEVGTLEAAFKAAIKNGIQPNVDGLAKLADEYNAIQDPVQRSQFAMDKFGRAGLDMAKLLEQGGDAIRDAAEEAKKLGLTLDDSAVKQAREFEVQLDNMGDKVDALKLKIGKGLLPVLNDFFNTMDKGIQTADLLATGSTQLSDAFTYTAEKMQADLVNGKMTLDEYNAGIQGMAASVKQWDELQGRALQNQFTLNGAQQQAISNYYQVTGAVNANNLAEENAARIAETAAQAEKIRAEQVQAAAQAQDSQYAALARLAEKEAEEAQRKKEAAEADKIYRASVGETITKIDSMAMSLAKSTDAQAKQMLAQASLDTIKKAYEDGKISQEGFNKATDAVLLRYDLATPKSLAMAETQDKVNKAFLDGKLPLDQYVLTSEKIPQIAADGKVTAEELAKLGIKAVGDESKTASGRVTDLATQTHNVKGDMDKATESASGYVSTLKQIPAHIETEVLIKYTSEGTPPIGGARANGGDVSAGVPYLVGERGPEVYVPDQPGRIIPNSTYNSTTYNVTTDRTGLAYMFERQRQAEARM